MVTGVGSVHKLGKYNRQRSVITNMPLNTNLPYYNSHDKYNKNIYVGSKEPITTETYYRPINDDNNTLCLSLAYFSFIC